MSEEAPSMSEADMQRAVDYAKNVAQEAGNLQKAHVGEYTTKTIIPGDSANERSAVITRERPGFDTKTDAFVTRFKKEGSMKFNTTTELGSRGPLTVFEKTKILPNGEVKRLERVSRSKEVGDKAIKFAAEATARANNKELREDWRKAA
jgi:hypothetical protein